MIHNSIFRILSTKGQSLVEVLIATVVGTIMVIAAMTVIAPALRSNTQVNRVQVATALGKELLENVRVFAEGDWHNIANLSAGSANHYYLNASSSPFFAVAGNEQVTIATTAYPRFFYVDNVSRDTGGSIVTNGGSDDPSTKKVTVGYNWPQGTTSTVSTYLTRNQSRIVSQSDWSGGPGQDGPSTTTNSKFSTSVNINFTTTTGSFMISL